MYCCYTHAGLIGTAPSQELLDIWNKRESALVEAGPEATTLGGVLHTRPLGELCSEHTCVLLTPVIGVGHQTFAC
jgi:formamidase